MLKGYSPPLSPNGTANLVPAPPWHYVGTLLVIDFWTNPEAVKALLPPTLLPSQDPGRCVAYFADWQACTDGGAELLDPVRAQYREFFLLVSARLGEEEVLLCPYIFVEQDIALLRGLIQGYPKQLGSVYITRAYDVASPASPMVGPGGTFAATLAVKDRRLAEATLALERQVEAGQSHYNAPLLTVRHFPELRSGQQHQPAVYELVRQQWQNRQVSPVWSGTATLRFFESPVQELHQLNPIRVGAGFRYTMAITISGVEQVRDLRPHLASLEEKPNLSI